MYYLVTHSFYKLYRISSKAKQMEVTHAEHAMGKTEKQEEWKRLFHECRFFKSFAGMLLKYFEDVRFRRTPTPLKLGKDPVPPFAFQ
jgi:hypothetical protein